MFTFEKDFVTVVVSNELSLLKKNGHVVNKQIAKISINVFLIAVFIFVGISGIYLGNAVQQAVDQDWSRMFEPEMHWTKTKYLLENHGVLYVSCVALVVIGIFTLNFMRSLRKK